MAPASGVRFAHFNVSDCSYAIFDTSEFRRVPLIKSTRYWRYPFLPLQYQIRYRCYRRIDSIA